MVSLYISHECALYQHVLLSVYRIIFYSMRLIPFRSPCFVYVAPKQRTRRLVLAPCESGATLSVKVVNGARFEYFNIKYQFHGLKLSWIKIAITSMMSLLANLHVASESEMCVNVHLIIVKVLPSEFFISVSRLRLVDNLGRGHA